MNIFVNDKLSTPILLLSFTLPVIFKPLVFSTFSNIKRKPFWKNMFNILVNFHNIYLLYELYTDVR